MTVYFYFNILYIEVEIFRNRQNKSADLYVYPSFILLFRLVRERFECDGVYIFIPLYLRDQ